MGRIRLGENVFEAAVNRMRAIFAEGHRVVVTFSAGKDSGCCLEVCLLAMQQAGRGNGGEPRLDVAMRDEEILYPGSFEYAERVAARPEVKFHWLIANQPIINAFNRRLPYWWVFDPQVPEDEWVRRPPSFAERIPIQSIQGINMIDRYPPAPGKRLYSVMGLRTSESARRLLGLHSKGGCTSTGPDRQTSSWSVTPIYDWQDSDVWKAIRDNRWDYNSAYDVMNRMGVPKHALRIAPPTMSRAAVQHLQVAARAWPQWFDRVARRVPGARAAAKFGVRAVSPLRRYGETWQACYVRECIEEAPAPWLAERATLAMNLLLERHRRHSSAPFPESTACFECRSACASWRALAHALYNGDPFALKCEALEAIEPEFFRDGAGTWGGKPSW